MTKLTKREQRVARQRLALHVQSVAIKKAKERLAFARVGLPPLDDAVYESLLNYARAGASDAFDLLETEWKPTFQIESPTYLEVPCAYKIITSKV